MDTVWTTVPGTVVEGSLSWQEYSNRWWDEHLLLGEIMGGPRTLLAFTGREWPIHLTISTREVDQESVQLNEFHPAAILEELFAQQKDILHSAVAVKEALHVGVEYHDNQSSDLNLHKQRIDDIYMLLKLHYVAAKITGKLIDFLQREILLHGSSILQDFRHYSFEGYPLSYEDEFLYYQAVEAFGITGLKWIGSPAFHLPPNDHAPINPNDGRRPCYVLDRCPLSGMLLFFPEEEEEDRRYVDGCRVSIIMTTHNTVGSDADRLQHLFFGTKAAEKKYSD
eukprot:scaffold772_cov76-Cylindrotheca_fusiformis.AAC.1